MKWILALAEGHALHAVPMGDESQAEMCIHYREVNPLPSPFDLPREQAREVLYGKSYRRFCLVRNPYSRIVSAWADKIRQIEPGYANVCADILKHNARAASINSAPTFSEFCEWLVQTNNADRCDPHWMPQTKLLLPELIQYDYVI
ncbi:MAG: sulfotransferase family 2 domain-containing protein, partial [Methylocystis sp.]